MAIGLTLLMYERGKQLHVKYASTNKTSFPGTSTSYQTKYCLPASNIFYGSFGRCQTESQAAVYKRRFSSPF